MKKILITGISSFIGFHLAKYFSQDFKVFGTLRNNLIDYNDIQKLRISILDENIEFIEKFDLSDHEKIAKAIRYIRPDYFIHHAGWAKLYGSLDYDMNEGNKINVEPLSIIYPVLKECGCKGIIITGTSAEYSDCNKANNESDSTFPTMPYGLSKLNETLYSCQQAYRYNLPTRVARVYIPFGTLDAPGKLIPSVIKNLKNNESTDLSPCEQKRDFIYVKDIVKIYEALLDDFSRNSIFDIFNACSGNAIRLKDLLLMISPILESKSELLRFGERKMRPGEPIISYGCKRKASDILNWEPTSLLEGLKHYINT